MIKADEYHSSALKMSYGENINLYIMFFKQHCWIDLHLGCFKEQNVLEFLDYI